MTAANTNMNYLLGKIKQKTFLHPSWRGVYDPRYAHHYPFFNMTTILAMVRDPRIQFALWLIKGPIRSYTKFFSEEESKSPDIHNAIIELNYHFPYAIIHDDKDAEEYILNQFNRFWEVGVSKAMMALEWGYSGSQVLYKLNHKKQLAFDNLYPYQSQFLKCLMRRGGIVGFRRDNDMAGYIPLGKGFWHIHGREKNPYYGESRLFGAHIPWHETWQMGGARDIRRTWFFRNSYDGGEMYFPEGNYTDSDGNVINNEQLALEMMEAKRTGSHLVFPSLRSADGKQQWEYIGPEANPTPQGLMEYLDVLRDEELEGLGIPPEVIRSEGSQGMGAATGRMVPFMAFIASLTPLCSDLIHDFRNQILDPILLPMVGYSTDYEVKPVVPKSADTMSAINQIQDTVDDTGLTT